jgi:hypothetical protein
MYDGRGLGIPYPHASGETWVMTLLSARDTPIARRFEIWTPNAEHDALIFNAGDCDQNTHLAADYQAVKIGKGEGTIGQVWTTGIPAVRDNIAEDLSSAGRSAVASGLNAMVAMPIMNDRGLKAVVVWYF